MTTKRRIDVYSASCPLCEEAIEKVRGLACSSCEVIVHYMNDSGIYEKAKGLGIRSLPAVVIDGKLAECFGNGIDTNTLRQAGLGKALS